ncbi:MAG: nuclease-related domain-containing protein [Methylophaga sp.]|nr:nuclease-related domain-containing protein [Methylophaga sp.]
MLDSLLVESIVIIALLLLLTTWLLFRLKARRQSANYRIHKILKPHQFAEARQLIIPDGIGGLLEIEHLVMLKQGLLIMHRFPLSGHLYGAEKIDQWTQLVDGRSYKFANPLMHLLHVQQSLSLLAPKVPIYTHVVFSGHCNFPKGKPDKVSLLSTLENDLEYIFKQAPLPEPALQNIWHSILKIARHNGHPAAEVYQ